MLDLETDLEFEQITKVMTERLVSLGIPTLVPAAMLLLQLKGKPYTLKNHYMFEPMFRVDPAARTVVKSARQVGKCVALSDLHKIWCADGSPMTVEKLRPDTMVVSMLHDMTMGKRPILDVCRSGVKPLLRISTRNGSEFKVSKDHRLFTEKGYAEASTMRIGTALAYAPNYSMESYRTPLLGDMVIWDRITEIKEVPQEETFDIEVDDTNNFVLDGIISHNSQNLAASRLLKNIFMPYYNTLFVCPRFEQVKRISNLYMKPLIYESPFKEQFVNPETCEQSILQRSFTSGSVQFFSFAFLDAERIRSVSAAEVAIDESVVGSTEIMPGKRIIDLSAGDVIDSFTEEGYVIKSVVNKAPSYHGRRRCFKVTTKSGLSVEGTMDHLISTSEGWLRIGEIIDYVLDEDRTSLHIAQPGKVPDIERVHKVSTRDSKEQRLRETALSLTTPLTTDLALFIRANVPRREADSVPILGLWAERLELDTIISIEYTGWQDVYDIEVVGTKTYFANGVASHNCQDINWDFIPVIAETLSGQEHWRYQTYTGTPKTVENTIERLWSDSTMAEWATKCEACNKWNISCIEQDAIRMIGKETVVCAGCGRPIDPGTGMWVHKYPDKLDDFRGYHVPQIIHPYHWKTPKFWRDLLYKMRTYPYPKFVNECLGESFDSATKLMTIETLRKIELKACQNNLKVAVNYAKQYKFIAMGIDWGGGGAESKSFTAVTIVGLRPGSDVLDTIYIKVLPQSLDPTQEIAEILHLIQAFNPAKIGHDYGGAGYLREVMLIHAGINPERIMPFTYVVSPSKQVITYNPGKKGSRTSYSIDRSRSIVTLCAMMKAGKVRTPNYEQFKHELADFLTIFEDRQERLRSSDLVLIDKAAGTADDVVHSLNYACSTIWYYHQRYPNLAEANEIRLSKEEIARIAPKNIDVSDWME